MRELVGVGGVVAALSVASDLTRGHRPGEAMRACLLATELARRAGLDRVRQGDVYYGTLLRFAGCAATSHEIAAAFGGDDIVVRARSDLIDPTVPAEAIQFLAGLGVDAEGLRVLGGPEGMARLKAEGARADCEVGADLAERLRLPEAVGRAVLDAFERFDGCGVPAGRAGDEVAEAARFAAVGYAAVMFDAVAGGVAAAEAVARWSGRALDPAVAAIFLDAPAELLQVSGPDDLQAAVAGAEPEPRRTFRDEAALDEALAGFGDAADLKSPWFTGHSRGVAGLARAAAERLSPAGAALVYRAGLVHDLGRVAVPAGVWERPGPLRPEDRELVRLHPYHTGRILARSPVLAPLGLIASRHHERTDGSGYPAGVRAAELDGAACLLAAADVLHALSEPRPHRPAFDLPQASRILSGLPLDRDTIRAVLDAAGAPPAALPPLPAAAGGVGHEGRCLAWAAAYMLAEAALPGWASGRRVVAVGGQTGRAVDDVGLVTDDDGWVMVQAKKGLQVGEAEGSPLAEALRQLVEVHAEGVPARPPWTECVRSVEADRDLVLVLTDPLAAGTVDRYLVPVTDRLRDLPDAAPLSDVVTNEDEKRALRVLREHLDRYWPGSGGLADSDFRRLTRFLSVRTMHLADGGSDQVAAQLLLGGLTDGPGDARRVWEALEIEAQRLAEERSFLDRNGLIRRLEMREIRLRPLARLRPDIQRLRDRTRLNMQVPGVALTIAAPETAVGLSREIGPAIAEAGGNLAITGAPGTGKTVLLYGLAAAQATADIDLVVLNAENLGATAGRTRDELNITHDLTDVLAGWTGSRPGLLLVDGLDQAWGSDAPAWLPDLGRALDQTRWRIVATIRTFDLKHGRRWRAMFTGKPLTTHADPELAEVRHLVVGDLTEAELAPVRQASPRLAGLLDRAGPRLRMLLANPFNLDLAGQLLADSGADLLGVSSRLDLLDRYWNSRVTHGTGALDRVRTLREPVRLMLAAGRQAVSPLSLSPAATPAALEALQHDGVLRDLPRSPGSPLQPVTFAHPVLFDYAVAVLALGETLQPGSLAAVLDEDPNLAITVRPSLGYRLAVEWAADATRRVFWHLALRLAAGGRGGGRRPAARACVFK